MGLLGSMVAGAAEEAGRAGEKIGLAHIESRIREEAAMRLQEHASSLQVAAEKDREQRGLINDRQKRSEIVEENLANAPRLTAAEVERQRALNVENARAEVDKFKQLAPLKRQEIVDSEVAKVKAMTTPEMLKAVRAEAMAKHIVDPDMVMVPQADGTAVMIDRRSGKTTGVLKDKDGSPIVMKNPEELKAATGLMTLANTQADNARDAYRIAEAHYKAQKPADPATDPKVREAAEAEFKAATSKYERALAKANEDAALAKSILVRKSGKQSEPPAAKPAEPVPAAKPALKFNPATGKFD